MLFVEVVVAGAKLLTDIVGSELCFKIEKTTRNVNIFSTEISEMLLFAVALRVPAIMNYYILFLTGWK